MRETQQLETVNCHWEDSYGPLARGRADRLLPGWMIRRKVFFFFFYSDLKQNEIGYAWNSISSVKKTSGGSFVVDFLQWVSFYSVMSLDYNTKLVDTSL